MPGEWNRIDPVEYQQALTEIERLLSEEDKHKLAEMVHKIQAEVAEGAEFSEEELHPILAHLSATKLRYLLLHSGCSNILTSTLQEYATQEMDDLGEAEIRPILEHYVFFSLNSPLDTQASIKLGSTLADRHSFAQE